MKIITGFVMAALLANAQINRTAADLVQQGDLDVVTDTGGDDTYVGCPVLPMSATATYKIGMMIKLVPTTGNTGAASIDLCSKGVKNIKTASGADPSTGDIVAGKVNTLFYDGTNMQMLPDGPGLKSLTLFDPVTTDSGRVQMSFPTAVTITRVSCSVKAATSVTINLDERAEATPDTTGTAVLTSGLVCDTNSEASTTFSNAGIALRVPVALTISAVTGTPDTLRVHVEYVQ
jgi:hypothetical protein